MTPALVPRRIASFPRPAVSSGYALANRSSSRWGSPSGRSSAARWTQPAERADVTALLGAARRPREARRRPPRELVEPRIGAVELGPVAVGALEVVAHDLVLLDERCVPVEPVGEGLVELGSGLLGERVVGGVADQEVAEAECLLVGVGRLVGADQLLPDEREEMGGDVVALGRRRQLLHGAAVEDLPFDGAAADHVALARAEPVEPGLQERLDRRRHHDLAVAAVLAHGIASISSMKSGFPSAACRILARTSSVSCAPPASREINSSQSSPESASSRIVVALSLPPPQPGRSSSSSGRAMQSRRIGASRDQSATCSIRSRKTRLGPLDVVEDDDLRPLRRARLDQLAERELRVGRRAADHARRARRRSRSGSRRAASR